jgi:AMP deaminase
VQDQQAFRSELPVAVPVSPNGLGHRQSVDGMSSSVISDSPLANFSRPRTKSNAKDDLTSPRIANLGLGLTPNGPTVSPPATTAFPAGPHLDQHLENADEIDEGFVAANPQEHITQELRDLYSSLQRCLDLRDKYMALSRQRLEDNPANYDGHYDPNSSAPSPENSRPTTPSVESQFKPWRIYPPPPQPHWKEADPLAEQTETTEEIAAREAKRREFIWEEVDIPGKEENKTKRRRFELNAAGVYQVYDENVPTGKSPLAPLRRTCARHPLTPPPARRRGQAAVRRSDDQGILPGPG